MRYKHDLQNGLRINSMLAQWVELVDGLVLGWADGRMDRIDGWTNALLDY